MLVGMPLKYFGDNGIVVTLTGVPHGWLYMVLLITAYDLGRRVHWPWLRLLLIALAGTVPFLSFVAEHYATKDVRARMAVDPGPPRTEALAHSRASAPLPRSVCEVRE